MSVFGKMGLSERVSKCVLRSRGTPGLRGHAHLSKNSHRKGTAGSLEKNNVHPVGLTGQLEQEESPQTKYLCLCRERKGGGGEPGTLDLG